MLSLIATLHTIGFQVQNRAAQAQTRALEARNRIRSSEKGATAVEYGIMVGLIAVVIIAAVTLIGPRLKGFFNSVVVALGGTAAA